MSWLTVGAAAEATETPLDGVRWLIGAGFLAAFTDTDGVTWVDPDDVRRQRAGLNDAPVAETLRNVADPWERAGVALRVMQALQGEIADLNDVLVGAVAELLEGGHEVVEIAERLACEPDVLPVPRPAGPGAGSGGPDDAGVAGASAAPRAESSGPGDGDAEAVEAGAAPADGTAPGDENRSPAEPTGDAAAPGASQPEPRVEVEGSAEVEGRAGLEVEGSAGPAPVDPSGSAPESPIPAPAQVAPDADLTAPVRLVEPAAAADDLQPSATEPPEPGQAAHPRSVVVDDVAEEATATGAVEAAGGDLDDEVGAAVLEFRRAAGDDQPSVLRAVPSPPLPVDEGPARPAPAAAEAPEEDQPMSTPTHDDEGPGIGWGPIDVTAIARTVSSDMGAIARDVGAIARTVTSAVGRVFSALRGR